VGFLAGEATQGELQGESLLCRDVQLPEYMICIKACSLAGFCSKLMWWGLGTGLNIDKCKCVSYCIKHPTDTGYHIMDRNRLFPLDKVESMVDLGVRFDSNQWHAAINIY